MGGISGNFEGLSGFISMKNKKKGEKKYVNKHGNEEIRESGVKISCF